MEHWVMPELCGIAHGQRDLLINCSPADKVSHGILCTPPLVCVPLSPVLRPLICHCPAPLHRALSGVALWTEFSLDSQINSAGNAAMNVNSIVGDVQSAVSIGSEHYNYGVTHAWPLSLSLGPGF